MRVRNCCTSRPPDALLYGLRGRPRRRASPGQRSPGRASLPFSATRPSRKYGSAASGRTEELRPAERISWATSWATSCWHSTAQRHIESEPEMLMSRSPSRSKSSYSSRIDRSSGFLQLDQEHTFVDRVQDARRHKDHVARIHQDSVSKSNIASTSRLITSDSRSSPATSCFGAQ